MRQKSVGEPAAAAALNFGTPRRRSSLKRLDERQSPAAFLAVSIAADPVPLSPAPVLDQANRDHSPAAMLDRSPRVEIVLSAGRRIIVEGGADIDVMLKLARGLEALR